MIKANIISIGNEIISGQIVNTNAAYLGSELFSLGIPVVSCFSVGDEIDSIVRILQQASETADVILITGGLGPTDDDLTRQGLAKFLNKKLELKADLLQKISEYFSRRNLKMSDKNKIQAYLPKGTNQLENPLGTAPGIMAKQKGKMFFALPGVPSEMQKMFADSIVPELKKLADRQAIVVKRLNCFGIGESSLAELLGDLMNRGRNPLINCTVDNGVITLHIFAAAQDTRQAQLMADKDEKLLHEKLAEFIFGKDKQTLAEAVAELLIKHKMKIAVAESCTGGLTAKLLTDTAGASEYFTHGWVTYSNDAKVNELGVPTDLIAKYGAVSEQVAEALAKGAREKAKADVAIGITGIAGPAGGTEQKPVGLVYICVDFAGNFLTKRYIFSQDRASIRLRAAQTALNMVRLAMLNKFNLHQQRRRVD